MSFRQTSRPQAARAGAASAPPLPGGYKFIPITTELISLLIRADSTFIRLVPIAEKYLPKILAARSKLKRKFVTTQMRVVVGLSIRESLDDSAIGTFLLTHDVRQSGALLDEGRESLLAAARREFAELAPKDFEALAHMGGAYFGQWVVSDITKRGAR